MTNLIELNKENFSLIKFGFISYEINLNLLLLSQVLISNDELIDSILTMFISNYIINKFGKKP